MTGITKTTKTGSGELRITFRGQRWSPDAGKIAAVIREALAQAFPAVKFTVRYRTAKTLIHPSWVSLTWQRGPSGMDVESAISTPLSNWQAAHEAKQQAARDRLTRPSS